MIGLSATNYYVKRTQEYSKAVGTITLFTGQKHKMGVSNSELYTRAPTPFVFVTLAFVLGPLLRPLLSDSLSSNTNVTHCFYWHGVEPFSCS